MGKPICVKGDICTGHGCYPPRPNTSWSPNVFAEKRNVHRLTDTWMLHCCGDCHIGVTAQASTTVFCNGLGVARIGDAIDCGSFIATGIQNIKVGD